MIRPPKPVKDTSMENQNYSLLLFLLITYIEKKKRATRKVRTVSGPGAMKLLQIQALYE